MDIIAKIRNLAKESDVSLSSICRKIGKSTSYFIDKEKSGKPIPDDVLELIAERLNTTVAYLKGEPEPEEEQKENRPEPRDGNEQRFMELFTRLPPEQQALEIARLQGMIDILNR